MAEELCASLETRGFACWLAPRDIAPAQPYALGCLQGIAESSSLLLLASESALASVQVLCEVEQAHKRSKPIYTVLIPPAKVRGEMDFYISRLHWIEGGSRTPEDLTTKLAEVLGRRRRWEEVASPPTLHRTMRYRPVAFAKLLAAFALGLVFVAGGLMFALNHKLNMDFRRWGYVELAADVSGADLVVAHVRTWVMADGIPFSAVRLVTTSSSADGKLSEQEFREWPALEQVGSQEMVAIPLEPGAQQVTTCLVVPSPDSKALYRVTQHFLLKRDSDGLRSTETAEPRVSQEGGSPCR